MIKVTGRKNPKTTIELGDYIGYPVRSWTQYPDGSFEIDLDVASLTPGQKTVLELKLEALNTHKVYNYE